MVFREIKLKTKLLTSLYDFYHDILNFEITSFSKSHFVIETRNSRLVFEETNNDEINPFYHFAFNIPSNKINEAYDWLEKRTQLLWIDDYKSYIADFRNWNARSVYFSDPGGNVAEFIARDELNDIVEAPFSSKHIRNVSEIGLVFPEQTFKESVERILKEYNLKYFNKQPPLKSFCAIGDDEGLFIIVPENRNWYPCSDKPAGIFPLQITFSTQNMIRTITLPT